MRLGAPHYFATGKGYPRFIATVESGKASRNRLVLCTAHSENVMTAVSIALTPGRTIRWKRRRFIVVDNTEFKAIIAREVGKRTLTRIPISEVRPDDTNQYPARATDL